MNRLVSIAFSILALLWSATPPAEARAQGWKLERVLGSERLAPGQLSGLVLPADPGPALAAAIDDFVALYAEGAGIDLRLQTGGYPRRSLYFKVDESLGLGGGFRLETRDGRLRLTAADEEGWANGLYAILHAQLGARWYWKDALGFEWVPPSRAAFPLRPEVQRPAFVQRRLHPVDNAFGRRNRLNRIYSFNHNLGRIFTPELFAERPEVFARINGFRREPAGSTGRDAQPDFTAPGTVEVAAQTALEHFRENPESVSFSLSINDNVRFDTGPSTEQAVTPLSYFRGRPNYTDLVFRFMNEVARRVFDEGGAWTNARGEERFLTALAYYWTEPAPQIKLHPRVMPVLTSDRAQWHDPAYRAEDKELIEAWAASGAQRLATWDYYFGAPYSYPRQFNQWIGQSIAFLHQAGVDVFFSQLPSFWGLDGPKAWLATQLLWDPEADMGALLTEFYGEFFGPAGDAMRRFYEAAEQHRNENEGRADWIKLYKDESGIALFDTATMAQMRSILDRAIASAGDSGRFARRVAVVDRSFRLTELYESFDRARRTLAGACFDGAPAAEVERLLQRYGKAREAYRSYLDAYADNCAYAPEIRHLNFDQSDPTELAHAALRPVPPASFFSRSDDPALGHLGSAVRNFLGPELPRLADWFIDYRPAEDFRVAPSQAASGAAGLRVVNADIFSLFGEFPVIPEFSYLLRAEAAWRVSLDKRAQFQVTWLDRQRNQLGAKILLQVPHGERSEHLPVAFRLKAPPNAHDARIRLVISRQDPGDYFDLRRLDFGLLRETGGEKTGASP